MHSPTMDSREAVRRCAIVLASAAGYPEYPVDRSRVVEGIMDAMLAASPMGLATPAREAVFEFAGRSGAPIDRPDGLEDGEEDLRRMAASCILAAAMVGDSLPALGDLVRSWRRVEAGLASPEIVLDIEASIPSEIVFQAGRRRDLGEETLDLLMLRGIPAIAEKMAEELLGR